MPIASRITRRHLLRGVCASVSLPFLDAMVPTHARGEEQTRQLPKVRAAYLYFPNGVATGAWEPKTDKDGKIEKLNKWMLPLESFKEDLTIFKKVWTPRGNGHSAGTATWLTGGHYNSHQINAGGISVDQLIASQIGDQTLLPSLELAMRGEGFFSKSLPRNTLSWNQRGVPVPRDIEPRIVFDRMFRSGTKGVSDKSVLDQVIEDAKSLKRSLGAPDQRKIDEYLEAIRSVEKRVEFADSQRSKKILNSQFKRPQADIPNDYEQYMRLMMDMVVLAFWSDATRVATYMLDHGQSNRYFNFIDGVKGTWHALSHWRDSSGKTEDDDGKTSWTSVSQKRDMYNEVVRWHHRQVAYLLGKMKSVQESDGRTLLDNSMILYGSSLSDGHEHGAKDLPLLLAGRGSGTIRSGREIHFRRDTSLSNLHLSMMNRLGVKQREFGGSDQMMTEIDA